MFESDLEENIAYLPIGKLIKTKKEVVCLNNIVKKDGKFGRCGSTYYNILSHSKEAIQDIHPPVVRTICIFCNHIDTVNTAYLKCNLVKLSFDNTIWI